jgi:ankyrin repeat protein
MIEQEEFFKAVKQGTMAEIEEFMELGAELSWKDGEGNTPLHIATACGHGDIVKYLIAKGVDVNSRDMYGQTPVLQAAGRNQIDMALLLIQCGADINAKDEDGWSPLHAAAVECHLEMARLLMESGAYVNARVINGMSIIEAVEFKRANSHRFDPSIDWNAMLRLLRARQPDVRHWLWKIIDRGN